MARRKLANPLALAVLALLFERPMHPYEMAATLRQRRKEESIKLNYGALYTVVELLQRHRLIVARETVRAGRYPERTVYGITEAGEVELHDWMRDLLSTPAKEYRQFEAGLALLPVLPPGEVAALLEQRTRRLTEEIERRQAELDVAAHHGLEPLFLVESEYSLALLTAERDWVRSLAARVADADWGGGRLWRTFQAERSGQARAAPADAAAPPESGTAPAETSSGETPPGERRHDAADR